MEIISRQEAIDRGLVRYFTGSPCKYGHIAERLVSNSGCIECQYERYRARYNASPDAARSRSQRYRQNNREKVLASQKEYRARNKAKRAASWARYYDRNKAVLAEKNKAYRGRNRDAVLSRIRQWSKRNQHRRTSLQQKRDASKMMAVPPWYGEFDEFVWKEAADLVIRRRTATGIKWAADHMIPLAARSARGLHVWNNCQVIPWDINQSKHNRMVLTDPLEWLARI